MSVFVLRLGAVFVFTAAALLAFGRPCTAQGEAPRILALLSHGAAPYREALEGFRDELKRGGLDAAVDEVELEGYPAKASAAVQELSAGKTKLVLALGTVATEAASGQSAVPVAAGMILRPEALLRGKNAAGVSVLLPVETQFQWMRRILPDRKRAGVLFNPAENAGLVDSARKAAKESGFELEAVEVGSPKDLPDAMTAIGKRADVLWGVPDNTVFTPQTAKAILLFSFRNRIPLAGLSEAWAKAGALYSLDPDYKDLGAQCGEIALQVLRGKDARSIPVGFPRKLRLSLNLKTAKQMMIEVPQDAVRSASSVVE